MESTVTSDGEPIVAAGRGVEQNQHAHDDLARRELRLFLYVSPVRSITVVTVMLRALDRVRGRALGLLGSGSPKSQPHQALRGVSKPTTGFPFTGGKW